MVSSTKLTAAKKLKKLKKLVLNPNVFWRDFFLKRAPLSHDADGMNKKVKEPENKNNEESVETLSSGFISLTHPIDVVITWVDGNCPKFQAERLSHSKNDTFGKTAANNEARYQNRDELRYSIRSILTYAPWVNKIYIVTNGQIPTWFNHAQDRVKIIKHDEIIDEEYLPTFNSHVIESYLHHIPDLNERYIYFNDDVMLLKPLRPEDFYTESGLMRGFISNSLIPDGPANASDSPAIVSMKNARDLLHKKSGYRFNLKFSHIFHPQRKTVASLCENKFAPDFKEFRKNKFRNKNDLLCTSFLFPCYAYAHGYGVFSKVNAWYFNIRDLKAKSLYILMQNMKGKETGPVCVCLNDHLPENLDYNFQDYEQHLEAFLKSYYPKSYPFEISENANSK